MPLNDEQAALFEPVLNWLDAGAFHKVNPNSRHEGSLGFNMDIFNARHAEDHKDKHCGTVCCIAGALTEFHGNFRHLEMMEVGAEIGLNWDEASNLFLGESKKYNMRLGSIKPEHAARTIRHFLETGVIDWEKTATEADELAFKEDY